MLPPGDLARLRPAPPPPSTGGTIWSVTMDLFELNEARQLERKAPLAARMRPRTLDEYVGQRHIMAPGRLLRRAIEADRLSSLIFYGPPGTGKTTLAQVIAKRTMAHFCAINAVLAGVKELRVAIAEARRRMGEHGRQTVLFIDEVHRFNKAQQDALLPWVERGTVILIGATTENPYFEVNKALVSRSRIFQLSPLVEEDLHQIIDHALADAERGFGARDVELTTEARAHLVNIANGDARSLLNALELAVETTPEGEDGPAVVDLKVAEESIQHRAVLYDKEGDVHFDTISAFIKSMRGSDPDAALYWLARMVYAGEDPRYIFRRLVIFAGEDVGLAQPEAVSAVMACAQAFDRVGMPEGRFHLAQATLYLATAKKSNSTMGFFDALAAVRKEREGDVPNHLKDGSRDKEGLGHGKGYLYPHAFRDHWVAQQYLPSGLQGRIFYNPSEQGYEARIHTDVNRRRDAQLAAMVEREALGAHPVEILTTGPDESNLDRWLQRTLGDVGLQLGRHRDRIFEVCALSRHHVVLDLNAGTGLLTWEAIRRTPEGGVYARCADERSAKALEQRAEGLEELRKPAVLCCPLEEIDEALDSFNPTLRFDRIVGRNALAAAPSKVALIQKLAQRLNQGGVLALIEPLPWTTERIYNLASERAPEALLREWKAAEEAIYDAPEDPLLNWRPEDLGTALEKMGMTVQCHPLAWTTQRRITSAQTDRWFPKGAPAGTKPSYAHRLLESLEEAKVDQIEKIVREHLTDETVSWSSEAVLVEASFPRRR